MITLPVIGSLPAFGKVDARDWAHRADNSQGSWGRSINTIGIVGSASMLVHLQVAILPYHSDELASSRLKMIIHVSQQRFVGRLNGVK